MTEIVWHGRGGQGAFTAARILGVAATLFSDNYALAFPTFGPERRGAPVLGFTKIHTTRIADRSEIETADFRIFLDDTLHTESTRFKLKESGIILVNTPDSYRVDRFGIKTICINATQLAIDIIGIPIANTAMLGALAGTWNGITLSALTDAINHEMQPSVAKKNITLLIEAYNMTKGKIK